MGSAPRPSSASPNQIPESNIVRQAPSTGSGFGEISLLDRSTVEEDQDIVASKVVSDVRRISGLTWNELGNLFHVSRRSVHFWVSGKPMKQKNYKFLMKLWDFVRTVDRGSARENRKAIFQTIENKTPFELMSKGKFPEAQKLLGPGPGRKEMPTPTPENQTMPQRPPIPPDQLVDAMGDRIHFTHGKGRPARTLRVKPREIE